MTHTSQISLCSDIATANFIYPNDLIGYFVFTFTSFFNCFSVTFIVRFCVLGLVKLAVYHLWQFSSSS